MTTSNLTFFQFEADFVQSLRCIPMQVRYKLDTCGVKLKLNHWHHFTAEDREQLVQRPCKTAAETAAYHDYLQILVTQYTQAPAKELAIDPNPPWEQCDRVPDTVQIQATQFNTSITVESWAALTSLQRFALYKLSRPSHENRNFHPALREFGLVDG